MSPTGTDQVAAIAGAAPGIGPAARRRLLEAGWIMSGMEDHPDAVTGTKIPADGGTPATFALPGAP
jgi:NADP-dependent 3-hydroxy acid dehydrogenase YdfG